MTNGSNIRAIGSDDAQEASDETLNREESLEPIDLEEEWLEEDSEPVRLRRWSDWIVPTIATAAILGWTGLFAWAFRSELFVASTPEQWISWIINWSVPTLLIATFWMLAMRLSRKEAQRFGDVAMLLRDESARLEGKLAVINRELSLAREFLGSQSRELESLGRVASERLSTHAEELQSLVQNNSAQVEAIASVSDTALINMGKLRDDLPVIANSARDVSNQVGQAGRTAHDQLDKLVTGFERLNEFGQASGRQVTALSEQIDQTISKFEGQLSDIEALTETRFAALGKKSEQFRVELNGREVDALAAMRGRAEELRGTLTTLAAEFSEQEQARMSALNAQVAKLREGSEAVETALKDAQDSSIEAIEKHKDRLFAETAKATSKISQLDKYTMDASQRRVAMLEEEVERFDAKLASRSVKFDEDLSRRQEEFETRETQASELLAQRLSEVDEMLTERRQAQVAQLNDLVSHADSLSTKIDALNALLTTVSEHSGSARETLGAGLGDLTERLSSSRRELDATNSTLSELTEAGIRLLEIIQSGARESREALPAAIDSATARLTEAEERAALLKGTVDATKDSSSGLSDYVITAKRTLDETGANLNALNDRLNQTADDSLARLGALRSALRELEADSEQVSSKTGEELRNSIGQLEEAAQHAFAAIETGANDRLQTLSKELSAKATAAIEESLREEGVHAVERIEQANLRASQTGRETMATLRDQLAKVNELAQNLEQRVARAREQAQDQVDNDFARRMALITESLNSNAIDIAKGLSQDVTDTAWASYLKGDRGIFTRRAVRLVDNAEAREIMDLYEADDAFREHVSRYIHDFEGMLRSVLSTRDGNALGVTLLSSDMGKLYVALAQSIERLRD